MRITAQISTDAFLAAVQDNAARVQAYEHGHDGSDGLCDCVGLIIGALRLAGIKYSGTHGSNYLKGDITSSREGDQMDVCDICRLIGDEWEMDDTGEIRHACDNCAHAQAEEDKDQRGD